MTSTTDSLYRAHLLRAAARRLKTFSGTIPEVSRDRIAARSRVAMHRTYLRAARAQETIAAAWS